VKLSTILVLQRLSGAAAWENRAVAQKCATPGVGRSEGDFQACIGGPA
jgi:hypothetical protein